MSYPNEFWYSKELRLQLVIAAFVCNTILVIIISFYLYKMIKFRDFNFVQKRHPNLIFSVSFFSLITLIHEPFRLASWLNVENFRYLGCQIVHDQNTTGDWEVKQPH